MRKKQNKKYILGLVTGFFLAVLFAFFARLFGIRFFSYSPLADDIYDRARIVES